MLGTSGQWSERGVEAIERGCGAAGTARFLDGDQVSGVRWRPGGESLSETFTWNRWLNVMNEWCISRVWLWLVFVQAYHSPTCPTTSSIGKFVHGFWTFATPWHYQVKDTVAVKPRWEAGRIHIKMCEWDPSDRKRTWTDGRCAKAILCQLSHEIPSQFMSSRIHFHAVDSAPPHPYICTNV